MRAVMVTARAPAGADRLTGASRIHMLIAYRWRQALARAGSAHGSSGARSRSGPLPGRKPAASATASAPQRSRRPTLASECASEPNETAGPPTSCHQRTMSGSSGRRVLISRTRPDRASAPQRLAILGLEWRAGRAAVRPCRSVARGSRCGPGPRSGRRLRSWPRPRRGSHARRRLGRALDAGRCGTTRRWRAAGRRSRAEWSEPRTRSKRPLPTSSATWAGNQCGSPISTPVRMRSDGNATRQRSIDSK